MGCRRQQQWCGNARIPALLAFLGGAFFSIPPFQEAICSRSLVYQHEHFARNVCFDKSSWRATEPEARSLIDDSLAFTGGSDKDSAWTLLSRDMRFHRVDDNTWAFEYRTFGGNKSHPPGAGQITLLTARMTIDFDSSGDQRISGLSSAKLGGRDEAASYPRDFTLQATVTHNRASLNSSPAQELGHQDTVRLLCRTAVAGVLWLRATDGWLPASELRYASSDTPELRACGPDHAARAEE